MYFIYKTNKSINDVNDVHSFQSEFICSVIDKYKDLVVEHLSSYFDFLFVEYQNEDDEGDE